MQIRNFEVKDDFQEVYNDSEGSPPEDLFFALMVTGDKAGEFSRILSICI
jgi:hypothetical protein